MKDAFKQSVVAKLEKGVLEAIVLLGTTPIMGEIATALQIIEALDDDNNCGCDCACGNAQYEPNIGIMDYDIETGTVEGFPTSENPTPELREVDENGIVGFSDGTEPEYVEPTSEDDIQTIDLDNIDENGFVKS